MSKRKHPLVGKFLHSFDEQGNIEYQMQIDAVEGDWVSVTMFSWMHGFANGGRVFPMTFIDKCVIYPDVESWNDEGARLNDLARRRAANAGAT